MGSRTVRFSFTPGENEQIEAVVKVPEEKRSIIHGIVKDHKNRIVKDAVVKLFEVLDPCEKCSMKPIAHTFTDECGQFLFGPLIACRHYAIKVWINNIKIRELIIHPDDCQKPHEEECPDTHENECPPKHHKDKCPKPHEDKCCYKDEDKCKPKYYGKEHYKQLISCEEHLQDDNLEFKDFMNDDDNDDDD